MQKLFLLLPSSSPSGPVKGALAIAHSLSNQFSVYVVVVKGRRIDPALLSPNIISLSLSSSSFWPFSLIKYRSILTNFSDDNTPISLSFCFSADFINFFAFGLCRRFSSVRGNLLLNYSLDYGFLGKLLARIHYFLLSFFDKVFSMSLSMQTRLLSFRIKSSVVYNFIDEQLITPFFVPSTPSGTYRFVFVGSLSDRKQPFLLIHSFCYLLESGYDVHLDMIGTGPLYDSVANFINIKNLSNSITLHGFQSNPFPIISRADVFVLPSLSEGVSRASLESLYLGIPNVLRDVDANSELITCGQNGYLFNSDDQLSDVMLSAMFLSRSKHYRSCLLPLSFRQSISSSNLYTLLTTY